MCYGTVNIPNSFGWRVPFILQTVTASTLAVGAHFLPYSPRWLLSKGRTDEARQVIDYLVAPNHADERRELLEIPAARTGPHKSQLESMIDIWRPGVRGRTILGLALNVFQQLSGIDFVRLGLPRRLPSLSPLPSLPLPLLSPPSHARLPLTLKDTDTLAFLYCRYSSLVRAGRASARSSPPSPRPARTSPTRR